MFRCWFGEDFFIIVPTMLSDCSRTRDLKWIPTQKLSLRNEFSISMRLRARLQFPRSGTENVHHETTRFSACVASIPIKFVL